MKRYIKSFMTVGVFSLALTNTSCVEDMENTSYATVEEIGASAKATDGLLMAMPQYLNDESSDSHFMFGYGCMMHMRDVLTDDQVVTQSGYDWFSPWAEGVSLSKNLARASYVYRYYYKQVQTANNIIGAVDPETASENALGNLGVGYAYRAMTYLDIARQFEYLPADGTTSTNADGNNVLNLTAPIVTEKTTEEESRNNPRATRQQMYEFILSDLDKAEQYIVYFNTDLNSFAALNTLPHLDCVYGLKARLYMWMEDYANAKEYARKAIDTAAKLKSNKLGGANIVPMTKTQCLDTKVGFNDGTKWMWCSSQTSEDNTVKSGIINWTSWVSNETDFGYASAGPYVMISKSLFDKIANTDFRKLMFKAPKTSPLFGQNTYCDEKIGESLPDYASLKFRPNEGNVSDYKTGAASSFPLMRVEEMYLIEAEAAAQLNPGEGVSLLNTFMKTYRDGSYNCTATSKDDVIEEIILQKRIELWGEGQYFFDLKRLNRPVTRVYKGTNISDDLARINTTSRPAWVNFVLSQAEEDNNTGIVGYNNPDPSGVYTPIPKE